MSEEGEWNVVGKPKKQRTERIEEAKKQQEKIIDGKIFLSFHLPGFDVGIFFSVFPDSINQIKSMYVDHNKENKKGKVIQNGNKKTSIPVKIKQPNKPVNQQQVPKPSAKKPPPEPPINVDLSIKAINALDLRTRLQLIAVDFPGKEESLDYDLK